jgi:hypothetical protein
MEAVLAAEAAADIGAHYLRPDILRLIVDRRPPERLSDALVADGAAEAAPTREIN